MIQLSTSDIERQITNHQLQFTPIKDDEIEWKFKPPPFVVAFVALIEQIARVPSQSEFTDFYIAKNRDELNREFLGKWDKSERAAKKRALIARLERAYPSFVRDFYLLALLREDGFRVHYDPEQDVAGGVDLIVTRADRKIQVHVFLDSPRSHQGRAKKNRRHAFVGEHFDLVLCREQCKQVGAFWLPTLKQLTLLRERLNIKEDER
jgi:hypothetical protein